MASERSCSVTMSDHRAIACHNTTAFMIMLCGAGGTRPT